MVVYISVTGISIFFAYFSVLNKIKSKKGLLSLKLSRQHNIIYKFFAVMSFLPLFIVSAIRYNVGTDYLYRYVPGLEQVAIGNKNVYEIGFRIINELVLFFTNDYIWIFIITSFMFCFFVYKSIYEQSVDICYSILLLVVTTSYFISMNIVRQCVCISIFLYAIKYIKQNKLLKYMICIAINSTIHLSSLIYVPIYFLAKIKVNVKKQILTLILIILIQPMVSKIFTDVIFKTKYAFYFFTSYNEGEVSFWKLIINLSILIFCYVLNNKAKKDEYYNIFTNLEFISVILLIFSASIPLISRVVMYFTFSQIIFLPKVISYIKTDWIRISFKILILFFYTIYMISTIVMQGQQGVLPYQTIFSR